MVADVGPALLRTRLERLGLADDRTGIMHVVARRGVVNQQELHRFGSDRALGRKIGAPLAARMDSQSWGHFDGDERRHWWELRHGAAI